MKNIQGEVISAKMSLTAIVLVKRFYKVPLYGKIIARKGKIHARNEVGAKEGQRVEIVPCRPYAKTVAFKISKIINSGKLSDSQIDIKKPTNDTKKIVSHRKTTVKVTKNKTK